MSAAGEAIGGTTPALGLVRQAGERSRFPYRVAYQFELSVDTENF